MSISDIDLFCLLLRYATVPFGCWRAGWHLIHMVSLDFELNVSPDAINLLWRS